MKNLVVKDQGVKLQSGKDELELNLQAVTFAKLEEICTLFGKYDIGEILKKPSSLDICKIAYCLLDDDSKKKLESVKVKLNDAEKETSIPEKLYYFISSNNVRDGYLNFNLLSDVVSSLIISSLGLDSKKKVILKAILLLTHTMWKSSLILLIPVILVILTLILFDVLPLDKLIDLLN